MQSSKQYQSVKEMLDDIEICGNCAFEDEPEEHPNCQLCITEKGNGFRPKKKENK